MSIPATQAAIDLGHVVNRNGVTDLEVGTGAAALAPALEALGQDGTLGAHSPGGCDLPDVLAEEQLVGVGYGAARGEVLPHGLWPGGFVDADVGLDGGVDEGLHDLVSSHALGSGSLGWS